MGCLARNNFGQIIFINFITSKLGESFGLSSNLKKQYSLRPYQKTENIKINNPNPFLFNFNKNAEWKNGSSLLYSYIQKRLPYFEKTNLKSNLNFLTFYSSKLLNFNNKYSLMEAPSPPISNILLPAKRYENYKRTFSNLYNLNFETNKTNDKVSDKIKLHQQQRLLKRLYNYPIKEFFRNEKISSFSQLNFDNIKDSKVPYNPNLNLTNFTQSYLVLAEIENLAQKNFASLNQFSSLDNSYRNILYNRHRTYLTNQWWNGQQGEHNSETTFLSDIDWRYTQISKIKSNDDIQIDFPDSEQFYNPRNRRWILTKGDWNDWFNIETDLKDIYSYYIYESFAKVYKTLDQNRELLDLYSTNLLKLSFNLITFKSMVSADCVENNPRMAKRSTKNPNKKRGDKSKDSMKNFGGMGSNSQSISFPDLNQREILNLYKRFFYKTSST